MSKQQPKNDESPFGAAPCSPAYFKDGLRPKQGDICAWASNGERWSVSEQDDIDNPGTALSKKEWMEDVIFIRRPMQENAEVKNEP